MRRLECISLTLLLQTLLCACTVDDEVESCSLLQVSSDLYRKQTDTLSAREAVEHTKPVPKKVVSATSIRPAAFPTWLEDLRAVWLWMFTVLVVVGMKPACEAFVGAVWYQKANSQAKGASHSAESPGASQCQEAVVTPPALPPTSTLLDFLPTEKALQQKLAILGDDSKGSLTYEALRAVIADPAWAEIAQHDCVVLALGPGIELAASLMSIMARTKCAPVDPNLTSEEADSALRQFGATAVLLDKEAAPGVASAAANLKLSLFVLDSVLSPTFTYLPKMVSMGSPSNSAKKPVGASWTQSEDVVLLLRTSGTTGKSKVVPLLLRQIFQGASSIALSMGLGENDICLNAMPLFHIGGISCNLFATLVSRGTVICWEKRFEPHSFASLIAGDSTYPKPTWYYATPSMHLAIVDTVAGVKGHHLRIVRSGAAALSPMLQERLEDYFACTVFATSSMTECMPVASPVVGEHRPSEGTVVRIQPVGSVGKPIGPSVEIQAGEIMLRGPLVTLGYWGDDNGWKNGLFATGDLGHLDKDGYLWLTGRRKEVINQGGETIAPQELEDIVKAHPLVREVAAYPVLHERLGEAVALAICIENRGKLLEYTKQQQPTLQEAAADIASTLAPGRRPALVAFVADLPRTATGKVQRLKSPWCCQSSPKGRVIVSGLERQVVVLDARDYDANTGLGAKRISPEAGTVVSIMEQDASQSSDSGSEEKYDSLGMLQSVGIRESFEMNLAGQLYVFGMLGITLTHIVKFGINPIWPNFDFYSAQTCGLQTFLYTLFGPHHLALFFVCSGYLDAQYSPDLGGRDVATFLLVFCIPLLKYVGVEGLLPYVPLTRHPARWFFTCLLACRFFNAFGRRFHVPKWLLVVVLPFYASIWQFLLLSVQGLSMPYGILHTVATLIGYVDVGSIQRKQARCTMAYVLASMFLPRLVKQLMLKGPRTKRKERMLGLLFWFLFACWVVQDARWKIGGKTDHYEYVLTSKDGHLALDTTVEINTIVPAFVICIPTSLMIAMGQACLLAAALAYFPMNLPEVFLNASFGALLIIPFPQRKWYERLVAYVLFEQPDSKFNVELPLLPAEFRLLLFYLVFSLYFAVLAPILQTVIGKLVVTATKLGPRMLTLCEKELGSAASLLGSAGDGGRGGEDGK